MRHIDQLIKTHKQWGHSSIFKDVRTAEATLSIFNGADKLIEFVGHDVKKLEIIEQELADDAGKHPTIIHLIVKAALSKLRVLEIKKKITLDLVIPMYHETIRMAPRASSTKMLLKNSLKPHVYGEDALLRKYVELQWLTRGSKMSYNLLFVDDICDQQSGVVARKLIRENHFNNCEVLFLDRAIKNVKDNTFMAKALETIIKKGASIRGGALCLGFAKALINTKKARRLKNTIIGYVDADASYSLTQIGIPLWQILTSESKAVTASRQHRLSYLERSQAVSQTSARSEGLIRLKQVVGYIRQSILGINVPADTQSGFKLFRPDALEKVLLLSGKAHNFSFDTQLLARIDRHFPDKGTISTFGVVCIDSDELSTANNGTTYYYALKILEEIAEDIGFDKEKNVYLLLEYLCKDVNNYHLAIRLLEDTADYQQLLGDAFPAETLLEKTKAMIRTDKDTTAVGSYFTAEIVDNLIEIFQTIDMLLSDGTDNVESQPAFSF